MFQCTVNAVQLTPGILTYTRVGSTSNFHLHLKLQPLLMLRHQNWVLRSEVKVGLVTAEVKSG